MNTLIARACCSYKGELMEDEVVTMLENEGNYRVIEADHPHYQVENNGPLEDDEKGKAIVFLVKTKNAELLSTLSKAVQENLLTGDFIASDISFEIGESYGN